MRATTRLRIAPIALIAVLALVIGASSIAFAGVSTDQADYPPGSVVTISGSNDADGAPGYQAGEAVDVTVTGPGDWTTSCTDESADADGAWSCRITLKSDDSAIGDYSYTAVSASGVTESGTFKDGPALLKSSHLGSTNPPTDPTKPGYGTTAESAALSNLVVPPAPNNWAWHFVFQGSNTDFATITIVFDPAPYDNVASVDVAGDDVTVTTFQSHPNEKHAYVFTPPGYKIVSGSATTTGTTPLDTEFNLSHLCAGTRFESSTLTEIHLSDGEHTVVPVNGTTDAPATVHDKATVTGDPDGPTPTGTVTFTFFTGDCETGVPAVDTPLDTIALVNGVADPSKDRGPLSEGDYAFQATYNGDNLYAPSTGECEPFEVEPAGAPSSTIQTFVHLGEDPEETAFEDIEDYTGGNVPLGSTIHDSALLQWAAANPEDEAPDLPEGSSVTFTFYKTIDCTGPAEDAGDPVDVGGSTGGTLTLDDQLEQGPLHAGSYGYIASFASGDDTIVPDSDGACEPVTVNKGQLEVATAIHVGDEHDGDVQNTAIDLGSTIHDSATVTGIVDEDGFAPDNNVEFTFHGANTLGNTNVGNCDEDDPTSDAGSVALDNDGVAHPSDSVGPLHAGKFGFTASIAGDDDYFGDDGACEPVTVNKAQLNVTTAIHVGDEHGGDVQNTAIDLGSTIHDSATVTGIVDGFVPANSVQFTFHGANTLGNTNVGNCDEDDPTSDAGLVALDEDGVAHPSLSQGPLHAGKYGFTASIAGDGDYLGDGGACEPVTVNKAQLNITTQLHLGTNHSTDIQGTSIPVNSTIHDSATVTGIVGGFAPANSVQFTFHGANTLGNTNIGNCDVADATSDAGLVALNAAGVAHPSNNAGPLFAGKYGFTASIAGDGDYIGDDSPCEPVTVKPQFGLTQGFWGNNNGRARLLAAGYPAINIGRGAVIDSAAESTKVLPNVGNACGKGNPLIFTGVGAPTASANCTSAAGINNNSLNNLASQTLALGYNIALVTGYTGQNVGGLQCTVPAALAPGLTSASAVNQVFTVAQGLIENSRPGGSTTQAKIGAMNDLLGCLNREA